MSFSGLVVFCFPVGEQRSSLCSMVKKEQTKTGCLQGKQFTFVQGKSSDFIFLGCYGIIVFCMQKCKMKSNCCQFLLLELTVLGRLILIWECVSFGQPEIGGNPMTKKLVRIFFIYFQNSELPSSLC